MTVCNTGSATLILEQPEMEVAESGFPPPVRLTTTLIPPGQTAEISLQLNQWTAGKQSILIRVRSNDPKVPEKDLIVRVNWIL